MTTHLIKRESASVNFVFIDLEKNQAMVQFKTDGSVYLYKDVNTDVMNALVDDKSIRLGEWVNQNLVHLKREIAPEDMTQSFIQHFQWPLRTAWLLTPSSQIRMQ